jgi:isoleucyl-tRNA synthetase
MSPLPPAEHPQPARAEAPGSRYRQTLNLPRTTFPMKANLVQQEAESLKRWGSMDLYGRLRRARAGRRRWVFHDGPPYANGPIHLGHLLNKVLKDFRGGTATGFRSSTTW